MDLLAQRVDTRTGDIRSSLSGLALSGQLHVAIREAEASLRAAPHDVERIQLLISRAWFGLRAGDSVQALPFIDEAVSLAQLQPDLAAEARGRAIRAWLLLEIGQGEEAAEEGIAALRIAEEADDGPALGWAFNTLGITYVVCGQLDLAEEFCVRAVVLARAEADPAILAMWLLNLGVVHHAIASERPDKDDPASLGPTGRAIDLFNEALAFAREAGDVWTETICLSNLAETHLGLGDVFQATAHLRAVDQLPPIDSDRLRTHRLELEGAVMMATGQPRAALEPLQEMVQISQRIDNHVASMAGYNRLAEAYEALGEHEAALRFFRRFHALQAKTVSDKVQQRARMSWIMLDLHGLRARLESEARQRQHAESLLESLTLQVSRLAEDSRCDALTGVGNRRHLDDALRLLSSGSARSYVVAMIDIDHFKLINDRYSHTVGDEVLVAVARAVVAQVRKDDVVVRYGGEEFAVLMYDVRLAGAKRVCGRILAAIRQLMLPDHPELSVTASIGVAGVQEASSGAPAVLDLADRRLYRAKRGGRDRVIWSGATARQAVPGSD